MTYLSAVLADSPVHYWRCADASGFLAHDIGSSPIHLAQSTAAFPYLGYSGISATGGSFAEFSAQQLWMPDGKVWTIPASFECWIWIHNLRNGASQDLFSWGLGTSPGMALRIGTTGIPQLFLGATNVSGTALTTQAWHHIVGTCTAGGVIILYVDAINKGTATAAVAGSATQPIHVGETTGNLGASLITEIAVYSAVLTPTQVNNHFIAQEVSSAPVYQQPGATTSGGFTGSSTQLADILSSVRKTY